LKRKGNLYDKICSMDNILLAEKLASMGKVYQYGVQMHQQNRYANLLDLQNMLVSKTYHTSPYRKFMIREPKEREIYCLPFFPDRIAHHAIMNVLKPVFNDIFTSDTYSSIEGRGIHSASYALRRALRDQSGTSYCLKMDIKKFYPSIDHDILKQMLRRKFKDNDLLLLLDEIIDSAPGVPIGNYLSQYFANFYLSYFDHWLKEVMRVPYYFRYKDDLVFLSHSKEWLHNLLSAIKDYLNSNLKLQVKSNYQVFPVAARGIDFVGYVHYHSHVRLRKTIKVAFARKMAKGAGKPTFASYMGWAGHCNSNNLVKKLTNGKV
jgi:RNA-directed DNA polymerase